MTNALRSVRVAILGSGPAGLTAALYAARAELKPLVISGIPAGGQLLITTDVENFPGFPEGIQGPELVDRMRRQAGRFGAEFVDDNVVRVDFTHRPFTLATGTSGTVEAEAVIIATGANARWLDLPSESRLKGHGVSACATCDGFFFKGKALAVVGGGDSAMEEALFLTNFATHVTILHRRDRFRASPIMLERARAHPKVSFLLDTVVEEVLGRDTVEGLRVKNVRTGTVSELRVGGLFVAIGHDPATEVFRDALERDPEGYLKLHDETRTSVEGVFAAGDVHDRRYRQAVTAAGAGCRAAIDVERWLAEQERPTTAALAASAPRAVSAGPRSLAR
ncbi:MAG TPA: thioredoxin-disulfide reductase [Thermoplasmata archaeon]|jgi:thioredoxin reductase (NADPH)|nr:thioredoxin-disulfide reductase [Thermoplasmata archaeon]